MEWGNKAGKGQSSLNTAFIWKMLRGLSTGYRLFPLIFIFQMQE